MATMRRTFTPVVLVVASTLALAASSSAQDWALARLEKSPRHHEWAAIQSGDHKVQAFVAYPMTKARVPVVIVIHENRGLSDWARGVADQLAEAGYVAVAPDLLSGAGPAGGRTKDFATSDAAREAIYALAPDRITADLDAVADYAKALPAGNGKLAVAGFCWGGGQSFRFATHRKDLAAAFVFYGAFEHTREQLAAISAPVYAFYAGDDERIGATVPATTALMKELGKSYDAVTYEGAGHGFMRGGEDPAGTPADHAARDKAWERWKKLLGTL
jgi:carboxymethylenebutenolidase